jgi:hypothetical protein
MLTEQEGSPMFKRIAAVSLLCLPAFGQKSTVPGKPAPRPIPTYEVKFEPDPKLSIAFDEAGYPAIFANGCDADGNPYVQVDRIIPPRSVQILKFSPDGIVTFETSKITDIVEPKWVSDFVSDSKLYMLVEGDTRTEQRTKKTEDGQDATYWETKGEPRYYLAQFDPDGSYKGALKLDLPFRPSKLSGFKSGSFLMAGLDKNNVSHVALLNASGQWMRDIDFPKEKKEPVEKTFARSFGSTADPDVAAEMLSASSSFFPYRENILYIRGHSGAPVYEIHEGGEAKPVRIKTPDDYPVDYLLPSDRNWYVVSTETGKISDAKSDIYELDPSTGETIRRVLAEGAGRAKSISEGQSDLACVHEGEFVLVRHKDAKLTVMRGTPVPAQKKPANP